MSSSDDTMGSQYKFPFHNGLRGESFELLFSFLSFKMKIVNYLVSVVFLPCVAGLRSCAKGEVYCL